jgi:hypothetical protein
LFDKLIIHSKTKVMFKFEEQENPSTGAIERVASFTGKLISVAKEALPNSNGKLYYPASVQFETANGLQTKSCMIHKRNFDYGMEVGASYLGKVTLAPDANGKISPIITLSHLSNADRATLADFGLDAEVTASADLNDVK